MTVEFTPWVDRASGFSASMMNAPLTEIADSANVDIATKADASHTHTESEITDIGAHNHDDTYYTETELNTSGSGGQVHWDNVTNKPTIGAGDGDVVGPATNTDNHVPQWDGADSKTLKNGLPVVTTVGDPGADTNLVTEQAVREAIAAIPAAPTQIYVVAGSYGTEDDLVPAEKVVFRHKFTDAVEFPAGLTGSNCWAEVAADAEAVFSITKNGSEVGTATFAAAGSSATLAMASATAFSAGDILRIVSPAQDTTLAGLAWSLRAVRT
jgi:hypothetical protein